MRTSWLGIGGIVGVLAAANVACGQSASISLTGVQIRNATNQSRDSGAQTIQPAARYRIVTSGNVQGQPVLSAMWLLYPNPTPLATILESFAPGSSAGLDQITKNPTTPPTHPFAPAPIAQGGSTVIGGQTVTFNATIASGINASNQAFFALSNVVISPSSIGYLQFSSGTSVVTRIPCPADYYGDRNGTVEPSDIAVFVNTWLTSLTAGTLAGDYDLNGLVEPADIASYISDWLATLAAGGCPS